MQEFHSLKQESGLMGGGGGPDSPDLPPGTAPGKRLQLSKESHSKKEQ